MDVATRNVPIEKAKECAILVIDMQEYCSLPERGYHSEVKREDNIYFFDRVDLAVGNIQKALNAGRSNKVEVLYTFIEAQTKDGRDSSLDYKLSGPILVPKNHQDARVLKAIGPNDDDILLPKTSCSVFQSTNIDYILRNLGTRNLVICGQLTNQCVESAVRDAADLGYLVTVLEDACAAETELAHTNSIRNMKGFARILKTAELVKELGSLGNPSQLDASRNGSLDIEASFGMEDVPESAERFETSSSAVLVALQTSLSASGVKYLRITTCDTAGYVRTKAMKLSTCSVGELANGVGMVECMMGLHCDYDVLVKESGLGVASMLNLVPDFDSFRLLPFAKSHASAYGYLCTPGDSREISELCPRGFLRRMQKRANSLHLNIQVGVELEFVLRNSDGSFVDGTTWASSKAMDESTEILEAIDASLSQQGIVIRLLHAEACEGQFELVLQHSNCLLRIADAILTAKQTIAAVAKKFSKSVSFVPKIHEMQAGSGMHVHLSCSHHQDEFMAGVLYHLPALVAILAPTTNSYRRLQPGCWAGSKACWGVENKEAALRLCDNGSHFECKSTDATSNPYLALGALVAAGIDGVKEQIVLPPPVNEDPSMSVSANTLKDLPRSLADALELLATNEVLREGLGEKLCNVYLAVKRAEAESYKDLEFSSEVELLNKRF